MAYKGCACKGIRTCLSCEAETPRGRPVLPASMQLKSYKFCNCCKKAWRAGDSQLPVHSENAGNSIDFPGIELVENFVTPKEEEYLCTEINNTQWVDSQSGRRKQDYGPKVNFKKKKLNLAGFSGLPAFSKFMVERLQQHLSLKDFIPVELCNLEYIPERGSAIDPHFDDFWLWGERLVTVNLLSDAVLTMTTDSMPGLEVDVPLPARALIIVTGPSRYKWKHGIKRSNIRFRRLAMTFRELAPEFFPGGASDTVGKQLLDIAQTFNGVAVGSHTINSG